MAGVAAWFASLSIVDILRSVALIVAFVATAFADRKGEGRVWLLADQIVNFAFGLGLFLFPATLMGYQVTTELTAFHQLNAQIVGLLMVACGLVWHFSGREKNSVTAWAVARTLSSAVLLETMLYYQYLQKDGEKMMTKQHQSFGILGATLLTLGHGLCAFRTLGSGTSRHPIQGWNRKNLALLAFLLLVSVDMFSSAFLMDSPEAMGQIMASKYKTAADASANYQWRIQGAMTFSLLFYGFAALTSLSQKEGTAVLLAGLWQFGLFIPLVVYQQNKHHFFDQTSQNGYLAFVGTVTAVCLAGTWDWFMGV